MEIGKFDAPNIALLGSDCGYLWFRMIICEGNLRKIWRVGQWMVLARDERDFQCGVVGTYHRGVGRVQN